MNSREASSPLVWPECRAPDLCPSPRPRQDNEDREADAGSPAGPRGAPVPAPKQRSRLATRFQVTAHWLLVAAGRTLAILLLALAGTRWARGGGPGANRHAGRGLGSPPGSPPAATWPGPDASAPSRPAGIAQPSAFSGVYFLVFLATCTWWACHFPIGPLGSSTLCVMVGCFSAGHLICVYCYQTPFAQAVLPPAGIWAR